MTLKKTSNKLIWQVYVGKRSKLYDHCVKSVAAYCKLHGIDHYVQTQPTLRIKPDPFTTNRSKEAVDRLGYLPIYEKENAIDAFRYHDAYEQVAIIDADVWIRPGSPSIFNELPADKCFGAVVERDMPITPQYANKIANYSRMQYGGLKDVEWWWNERGAKFMNMGVIVMNQSIVGKHFPYITVQDFIMQERFKRFVDGVGPWKWSTDQTMLNYWVRKDNVPTQDLNWKWNGLFKGIDDKAVKKAYFVHFFLKDKLPNRGEDVDALMAQVQ